MKKLFLSLIIMALIVPSGVFAEEADITELESEITTDLSFTAFTSDEDSSLEGWTGYSKNSDGSINSSSWYTFKATKRLVGNVIANMPESWQDTGTPSPSGSVFYTAQNFGSEYRFSGDFYNWQNTDYIYFNASVLETAGQVTAKGGYRLCADRSKKTVEIQKFTNSSWETVDGKDTGAWTWALCHFDITFADGKITAKITHSDKFDITLSYDASLDDDYKDTGYIGFGSYSGKMTAGKININYNSEKVYVIPKLRDAGEVLKGYSILPAGKDLPFVLWLDFVREGDVSSCNLYVDNAFAAEMEKNGDCFTAYMNFIEKGTHTVRVELVDCYGNEEELVTNTFFVSDFASYPALFTDLNGNPVHSIDECEESMVVTFKFNPYEHEFSSLMLYAVKYDENGKMIAVYPKKILSPALNTETEISVEVDDVVTGQSITAFLFEDYSKPSPLSGGFTLK